LLNPITKKLARSGGNAGGIPGGAAARRITAFALCGIAVVLPGCSCSFSVGSDEKTVHESSEASQARKTLDALPDLPPTKSVDCPSDVEAKADTTYECQATLTNGQEVTLPARVASVNGDHADIESNLDVVIQALAVDVIYKAFDPTVPASVECPTDVPATVNKTFDCKVTSKNGTTDTVTLRINATTPRQDLRVDRVHGD
jgi:hypothetical protein